jgi:TusE/DsrC/DsvC family sulfur relay protein
MIKEDIMGNIVVNSRTIEVGADGYLSNEDDWSEDVARTLADAEGIAMTDQHWEIVHFLREYYKMYQIAPMIKILLKAVGQKLGPNKGTMHYIYTLFPDGPAKQACKIAGLPRPAGCV